MNGQQKCRLHGSIKKMKRTLNEKRICQDWVKVVDLRNHTTEVVWEDYEDTKMDNKLEKNVELCFPLLSDNKLKLPT